MMITLGGRPYVIQKLEGKSVACWQEAFRLFRQTMGCPPDEIAALMAWTHPQFMPWLATWLPNYDSSLPWHEGDRGELLTALLAIAHLEGQP